MQRHVRMGAFVPVLVMLILGLLGFPHPVQALNYTVKGGTVIFPRPTYNVEVTYIDRENKTRVQHSFVARNSVSLFNFRKVISVTWDNSTWIQVDKVENLSRGSIHIEGKTENALLCLEARNKTGEDWWNDEEHCYTKITVFDNGKPISETFADEDGNWDLTVNLAPGKNNLRIVAQDPGGNTAEKTIEANWDASPLESLGYYLSLKDTQLFLAGIAAFAVITLILVKFEEKRKKAREEAIKRNLGDLFRDEELMLNKGVEFTILRQTPEFRVLIKKILSSEPFYSFIEKSARKAMSMKNNPEALKRWLSTDFRNQLIAMVKKFDPNVHRLGNNGWALPDTYYHVAVEMIKEKMRGEK